MNPRYILLLALVATSCGGGGAPAERCPEPITAKSPPECIPPIPLPQPKGH
jgi:hypothetical protein